VAPLFSRPVELPDLEHRRQNENGGTDNQGQISKADRPEEASLRSSFG
jgi:hypothetical protein